MPDSHRRGTSWQWAVVLVLTLSGYLAGFNVGKVSATLPYIRAELDLSLVLAGSIASSYSLVAMFFSVLLGVVVSRFGAVGCVTAGLLLIAVAGAVGAGATDYLWLLVSRVTEGVGYVLLAIATPILIARVINEKSRPVAMGGWGTFLPGGVALSMFIAPLFPDQWRPLWWVTCIYAAVAIVVLLTFVLPYIRRLTRCQPAPVTEQSALYTAVFCRDPLLLAASFMFYSMFFVTLVTFLPTVLSESSSLTIKAATSFSVFVVLCNILGNLTGGWLIGRGVSLQLVLRVALVGSCLLASLVFLQVLNVWLRIACGLLACYLGGMLPAAVFSSIARFVPAQKSGLLLGVVFQALGCGQVAGPVTLAALVEKSGSWQTGVLYFLCLAVAGFVVLLNFQSRKELDKPSPVQ